MKASTGIGIGLAFGGILMGALMGGTSPAASAALAKVPKWKRTEAALGQSPWW